MEIKDREELPRLKKLCKIPKKQVSWAYYEYHQNFVLETKDCFQLHDEIEALIHQGKLGQYVDEHRSCDDECCVAPSPPPQ